MHLEFCLSLVDLVEQQLFIAPIVSCSLQTLFSLMDSVFSRSLYPCLLLE